jgi:hypothetical protein
MKGECLMLQLTEEELLMYIKSSVSELNTLAEIHKLLVENNIRCSIEELRRKISPLYRDGYLGNEPTVDGVNMYYIIYYPEQEKGVT